ncbi:MAG: polysaccharide deacetylase family protein [Acidimicrobiales bacterium]
MSSLPRQLVKYAAATVDTVRRRPPGVVILIYHCVGGGRATSVDLPVGLFEEQVAFLAEHATVLDLDAALDVLAARSPLPSDAVVLTFDDGTADLVDHALPVLERYRLPATLYVATGFVGASRSIWGDPGALSWEGLREMVSTGLITLGSHTHSHVLLDRLPSGEIADELDRSVELIGERVGVEVHHFAYPKALAPSPEADAEVRRRFRSAALAGTRANVPGRADLHRLARSPVQVADGMRWFERKVRGGMGFEDALRGVLNRRRYAGATT